MNRTTAMHASRMTLAYLLATGLLGCLLVVLAYSAFTTIFYAGTLIDILSLGGKERQVATALMMFGAPLAALHALARRRQAFPPALFLAGYALAAVVLCVAYAHKIHPNYVSDFKRMWDAATVLADSGLHPVAGIIQQRALPVLYPVVKVFGPNPIAVKVVNGAMFVAIGLLGYDALRTSHGHRMAQAFALAWLCSFEPLMSIGIPTHDLWGLFFIALAVWAAARACDAFAARRGDIPVVGWTALVGILLALVQLQREVGVVLLIAALLSMACLVAWHRRGSGAAIAPMVVLVLAYVFAGALFDVVGARAPEQGQQDLDTARLAGFSASFSDGRFSYGLAMRKTFVDTVPRPEARALSHAILLSDIAEQPGRRIASVTKRLDALAQPGSQLYFYAAGAPRKAMETLNVFVTVSALFSFGLAAAATVRLLQPSRRRVLPVTAMMVLFGGGMIAICCMLSEMQPRYVFFMWFIAAMLVAEGFFAEGVDDGRPEA